MEPEQPLPPPAESAARVVRPSAFAVGSASRPWLQPAAVRRAALRSAVFAAAVVGANLLVRWLAGEAGVPCPRYWPLNVFHTRWPDAAEAGGGLLLAGVFACALRRAERTAYRNIAEVAAFGTLLVLGTNATQGSYYGFTRPVAGGGAQYYHDARRFGGAPAAFLRDFGHVQPTLGAHGRTHPPGAVLLTEALRRLTGDRPAAMSLLIAIASAAGSAFALRDLVASVLPKANANGAAFLLLSLPAVQIYYCASLDAVIATLLLGAAALCAGPPRAARAAGAALCLGAASFLTFGFVWALPVLLAPAWARPPGEQRARALLLAGAIPVVLTAAYAALFAATGFGYLAALRTAAVIENPGGFRLLSDPAGYLLTRLEDVGEIVAFAGPFLLASAGAGLRRLRSESRTGHAICVAALGSLLLLFLTGAYRTGETARACLFVWPFLVLPAVAAPAEGGRPRRTLLCAVFGQALLMQLFGRYFW